VIAGLALGEIETAIAAYGGSAYRDALVYLVLILLLFVRPYGLFGQECEEKA
jgi:branched-chain amino acid transport system permease protein